MLVELNGAALVAVVERSYEKNGETKVWREVHLSTGLADAPKSVRIDAQDAQSVGAFRALTACAHLDRVDVDVRLQDFGQQTAMVLAGFRGVTDLAAA